MVRQLFIAVALACSVSITADAQTYYAREVDGKAVSLAVNPQNSQPVPAWCTGCVVVSAAQYATLLAQIEGAAKSVIISKDDFWARFTGPEQTALAVRSRTDNALLRNILFGKTTVNLAAPAVSAMLDSMIASGDLAANRKAAILAAP